MADSKLYTRRSVVLRRQLCVWEGHTEVVWELPLCFTFNSEALALVGSSEPSSSSVIKFAR